MDMTISFDSLLELLAELRVHRSFCDGWCGGFASQVMGEAVIGDIPGRDEYVASLLTIGRRDLAELLASDGPLPRRQDDEVMLSQIRAHAVLAGQRGDNAKAIAWNAVASTAMGIARS